MDKIKSIEEVGNQEQIQQSEQPNALTEVELQEVSKICALRNTATAASYLNWLLGGFNNGFLTDYDIDTFVEALELIAFSQIDESGPNNWSKADKLAYDVLTQDSHISLTKFNNFLRIHGLKLSIHAD